MAGEGAAVAGDLAAGALVAGAVAGGIAAGVAEGGGAGAWAGGVEVVGVGAESARWRGSVLAIEGR